MDKEKQSKTFSRREIIKGIGIAVPLTLAGTGCASAPEILEKTPQPTPSLTPTQRPTQETQPTLSSDLSPEPTVLPTPEAKRTPSPETIVFPQTELNAEFVKQGFYGIGGAEEVDLGAMATPEVEKTKTVSWQTIEGYTSLAWDQEISLEDLSKDEVKATKAVISLGSQVGVEGFYRPGEVLPHFKDLTLLRLTINRLPNNQDFYDTKLNASPQNLIIRKGTHLTVLGLFADASGRWATVAIDEGFDREKRGIQARDVPRQILAVIPQDLPEGVEGLSLERLLNANNYLYSHGVVEHLGETGKLYHQELNIIEPSLAKKLEKEAGALFMDQKEDGTWYENPIVPYPPQEIKSTHTVKSGEYLSTIAQKYGLTVDEILKVNPEIKDPSKINVGQEITIIIPGFTDYYGPIETTDHRAVILSLDQTQELAEAIYDEENKKWNWVKVGQEVIITEPTQEATPEVTKEQGVLYEKDFEHLRGEKGEWRFGKIFWESVSELQRTYYMAGVILSEPEKRQVRALDNNGNLLYTYEVWFVKIGYADPQSKDGKLVEGEVIVWKEGMDTHKLLGFAKDGFVPERIPTGSDYQDWVEERDEFLAMFKYGRPAILSMMFDATDGAMNKVLAEESINELFPGQTPLGKNIYFVGLLFDDKNGIGRLDLPEAPTVEEIKAWRENGQIPGTNFLGELGMLIISDKYK